MLARKRRTPPIAPLNWRLRWRLSVLWALEWGITGAILTYLPLYFQQHGLTPEQMGRLMAVTAVGLWVAPFVVGQVCDRWLASEKYLAISHFVGGLTLLAIPLATRVYDNTGENFTALLLLVGLYAMAYFPTIPLASSLTFRHLPNPDVQFPGVRIWGTVGWVMAGVSLSLWLGQRDALAWLESMFPNWATGVDSVRAWAGWVKRPESADSFHMAALLSFALSSFCVFLPSTPPAGRRHGAIAPLQVLAMFRNRTFTQLIAISLLLAGIVAFYTLEVPKLLEQSGFTGDWVPAVMTVGQISEFPALLLLPFCLRRFGLKATFAVGMGAWLVRYVLFAAGGPLWLLLTGVALHGVCHVFLIIVIQLYVDSVCRSDLRASAQNLFAFITMGIGLPLGFLGAGYLGDLFHDVELATTDYRALFSVPSAILFVLLLAYWKWFEMNANGSEHDAGDDEPATDGALAVGV